MPVAATAITTWPGIAEGSARSRTSMLPSPRAIFITPFITNSPLLTASSPMAHEDHRATLRPQSPRRCHDTAVSGRFTPVTDPAELPDYLHQNVPPPSTTACGDTP